MKSAFEKAMERLERESGPTKKLNDEQKARMAEIDRKIDAQVASRRLALDGDLGRAANAEEYSRAQAEFASDLADLESRREREKESIWSEAS